MRSFTFCLLLIGSVLLNAQPNMTAPDPTRAAETVISMYSDVYDDVPVDTWRTDWSSAILEDIEIQGNPTKKYSQLDFVGIETVANQLDITEMTHFHLNIWSSDYTFFGVKLVDFGADGAFGGGDDVEHQVDFEMPEKGKWVSLDIPLSAFEGLTTRKNIAQLILVGRPTGSNTVFVDNVYFYKDSSTSTFTTNRKEDIVKIYPNPVKAGMFVNSDTNVLQMEIFDFNGRRVKITKDSYISTEGMVKGIYIVRIQDANGNFSNHKLFVK